jgi:hypothetical protein
MELSSYVVISVALYEYEAWLLTQAQEHRYTRFDNVLLRRIFQPKRGSNRGKEKIAQ